MSLALCTSSVWDFYKQKTQHPDVAWMVLGEMPSAVITNRICTPQHFKSGCLPMKIMKQTPGPPYPSPPHPTLPLSFSFLCLSISLSLVSEDTWYSLSKEVVGGKFCGEVLSTPVCCEGDGEQRYILLQSSPPVGTLPWRTPLFISLSFFLSFSVDMV